MTVKSVTETARILSIKKTESRLDEISEKTGASTATISRVNRAINKGFNLAFQRVKK